MNRTTGLILCWLAYSSAMASEPAKQQSGIRHINHADLSQYADSKGDLRPIQSVADWEIRRGQILEGVQKVMGSLPAKESKVPLDMKLHDEKIVGTLVRRKVTFQSDADDRVPAFVMFLRDETRRHRPAVLCLHQTTAVGKDEPTGLRGDPELRYALELAERGYVVIAPDYPTFGEHPYDFQKNKRYVSGSMKAIWDNIRAVDLITTLPEVDPERIGVIGHSLGGHNAMFTALFDPRLKAIVSSCGFTALRKDDLASWTGPTYMPRIASEFRNDIARMPFEFDEIVAALAPRAFFASAATQDDDFDVSGVRDVIASAIPIYKRYEVPDRLVAYYPPTAHSFPRDARKQAYEFLDRILKP